MPVLPSYRDQSINLLVSIWGQHWHVIGIKLGTSLACKSAFYRQEHNWIFKVLSPKSRWKKWGHCVVIMFTPRFMVIKMSKMALFFCIFCRWQQKSVTVWAKYLRVSERSYLTLQKKLWIIGFWAFISKMWTLDNIRFWYFFADSTVFLMVSPKPINHIIFWKKSNKIFQVQLNILPELWLLFRRH